MISTNPVTEIKAVSFSVICQTFPNPGKACFNICGPKIFIKVLIFDNPRARAASICPLSIILYAPRKTSVEYAADTVSYTHLTLPTSDLV